MFKVNKIICILIASSFFLNIILPDASACWWKGAMPAHGSPEVTGTPTQGGNNTGLPNQSTFAEPIYLHNGDFVYEFQDLFIPSRGLPVELKHTYKSQSVLNNRFGCGWDLSYNQRIAPLSNGDAYYFTGSNMRLRFSYLDGKNYISPSESYDKLVQNTDGTWTLTKKYGEKYYFDQNGLLTKIEDRNKNAITFSYNPLGKLPITGIPYFPSSPNPQTRIIAYDWQLVKVTDTVGRDINFTYDENGRLKELTDFSGRKLTYTYDTNGDLIAITRPATEDFPSGTTWRFAYANHKLTTITDPKNQTYLTNFYNGQGLVDAQETAGNKVYINYDLANRKTEVKDAKNFRTVYTFNSTGNPLKKEEFTSGLRVGEPTSYVTTSTYNSHLELTKVTYPKGNSIIYTYDSNGNLQEIRRKPQTGSTTPDIVTQFTYEAKFNFIKTLKDSRGNTTTYYYDYEEATLGDLNGDGVTDQSNGNLVKITYPAVGAQIPETKFTYNSYGQVLTVTDPNANTAQYEYYLTTGYLAKVINAFGLLNLATEMTYDTVGNVLSIKDPKANTTTFEYDSHNNLSKAVSAAPFNYVTTYKYDANDNLIQVDRQTGNPDNPWQTTYYTYDALDRLETIKDELNNLTTFGYDKNGNRSSIQDAELNSTRYEYDERNFLWKVTDASGNLTEYAYDENGNLKEIRDAKGNTTLYIYDDFDRLKETIYADLSYEEYTYDANSNLTTKTDPKTQTIYYEYDALNRLSEKGLSPKGTVPESVVTYSYDVGSRLASVTDTNGAISYNYDAVNRITQVTYPGSKSVSYTYDSNSNRTKLTYPDSSYISYDYDQFNRLTTIKDQAGSAVASYQYDALSRRTQLNLANNTQATYTYDDLNRLTQLANRQTGQPANFSEFTYTYDKVGNRLTMTTLAGSHNYTYDNIYQLKTVDYPAGFAFPGTTFNFDAVGNRLSTVNGGTVNYTPNSLNQYSKVGSTDYTHDANGNLTSDGTFTYAYDYENRLTSATKTGTTATYKYDPFGRRTEKDVNGTTTKFLYDGDQLIAEYDASNNLVTKYIYGLGIDEPINGLSPQGTVPEWFYHFDGLGSVTNLTNSSGSTLESYSYDAFGKPNITSTLGNRFMFTGREYDEETGLYYYRARYYSPELGRFLQRDPLTWAPNDPRILNFSTHNKEIANVLIDSFGRSTGINQILFDPIQDYLLLISSTGLNNPQYLHSYLYVLNNPINWVDPFGLDKDRPWWKDPGILVPLGLGIGGLTLGTIGWFTGNPFLGALGYSLGFHALILGNNNPLGIGLGVAGLGVSGWAYFTGHPFLTALGISIAIHGTILGSEKTPQRK